MKWSFLVLILIIGMKTVSSSSLCNSGDENCLLEKNINVTTKNLQKNLNNQALEICSIDPLTGYDRSGFCTFYPEDVGRHLVCAEVNKEFLEYTKSQGNDLSTPNPRYGFRGLVPGDRWCLCSSRVIEANRNGMNLKIIKEATHEKAWGEGIK